MNKYEENKKIVDDWIEKHKADTKVPVVVDQNTRYLMASEYLAGYNEGMFKAMNKFMPAVTGPLEGGEDESETGGNQK